MGPAASASGKPTTFEHNNSTTKASNSGALSQARGVLGTRPPYGILGECPPQNRGLLGASPHSILGRYAFGSQSSPNFNQALTSPTDQELLDRAKQSVSSFSNFSDSTDSFYQDAASKASQDNLSEMLSAEASPNNLSENLAPTVPEANLSNLSEELSEFKLAPTQLEKTVQETNEQASEGTNEEISKQANEQSNEQTSEEKSKETSEQPSEQLIQEKNRKPAENLLPYIACEELIKEQFTVENKSGALITVVISADQQKENAEKLGKILPDWIPNIPKEHIIKFSRSPAIFNELDILQKFYCENLLKTQINKWSQHFECQEFIKILENYAPKLKRGNLLSYKEKHTNAIIKRTIAMLMNPANDQFIYSSIKSLLSTVK